MLVLSRDKGESVCIDLSKFGITEPIVVTMVETRKTKARLGFDGPRDIPVHRKEVWDAIQRGDVRKKKGEA